EAPGDKEMTFAEVAQKGVEGLSIEGLRLVVDTHHLVEHGHLTACYGAIGMTFSADLTCQVERFVEQRSPRGVVCLIKREPGNFAENVRLNRLVATAEGDGVEPLLDEPGRLGLVERPVHNMVERVEVDLRVPWPSHPGEKPYSRKQSGEKDHPPD